MFLLVVNLCLGADKLIIFLASDTLHLPPGQVGLVVSAGGVGGLLGAASTGLLCRWLGPLPVITLCCAASGLALLLIGAATSMPVPWPETCLRLGDHRRERHEPVACGRSSSRENCWAGSPPPGGSAARRPPSSEASWPGRWPALLGNDPRPVFAAAGCLTLLTVAVAWFAGLQKEDGSQVAVSLTGK